jgi:hypothetical protein
MQPLTSDGFACLGPPRARATDTSGRHGTAPSRARPRHSGGGVGNPPQSARKLRINHGGIMTSLLASSAPAPPPFGPTSPSRGARRAVCALPKGAAPHGKKKPPREGRLSRSLICNSKLIG